MNTNENEDFDKALRQWHHDLSDEGDRVERMVGHVLSRTNSQSQPSVLPVQNPLLVDGGSHLFPRAVAVVACGVCVVLAGLVLTFQFEMDTATTSSVDFAQMKFSTNEITQQEKLVCHLDEIFEHQVGTFYQSGEQVSFEMNSVSPVLADRTCLSMRFVLQERASAGDWRTLQSTGVITGRDAQIQFPSRDGLVIDSWSHVLPDDSLWIEVGIRDGNGQLTVASVQCKLNEAKQVWARHSQRQEQRLIVVFELLRPCSEVI
ncbi:MAG: hypothetical protein R3C18_26535 [Planctomycetaceae bacterium]